MTLLSLVTFGFIAVAVICTLVANRINNNTQKELDRLIKDLQDRKERDRNLHDLSYAYVADAMLKAGEALKVFSKHVIPWGLGASDHLYNKPTYTLGKTYEAHTEALHKLIERLEKQKR